MTEAGCYISHGVLRGLDMLYFKMLQASLVEGSCEEKVGLKAKDQPSVILILVY